MQNCRDLFHTFNKKPHFYSTGSDYCYLRFVLATVKIFAKVLKAITDVIYVRYATPGSNKVFNVVPRIKGLVTPALSCGLNTA